MIQKSEALLFWCPGKIWKCINFAIPIRLTLEWLESIWGLLQFNFSPGLLSLVFFFFSDEYHFSRWYPPFCDFISILCLNLHVFLCWWHQIARPEQSDRYTIDSSSLLHLIPHLPHGECPREWDESSGNLQPTWLQLCWPNPLLFDQSSMWGSQGVSILNPFSLETYPIGC